jgi:hypothetical protein
MWTLGDVRRGVRRARPLRLSFLLNRVTQDLDSWKSLTAKWRWMFSAACFLKDASAGKPLAAVKLTRNDKLSGYVSPTTFCPS